MKYITVEQFKEQPLEVQKVFLDWWKPQQTDLFQYKQLFNVVDCLCGEAISPFNENYVVFKKDCIPLLTEGQLREFIEDKTNCKAIPNILGDTQFSIELYRLGERCFTEVKTYDHLGDDLLQAYWKVACEVAKVGISHE